MSKYNGHVGFDTGIPSIDEVADQPGRERSVTSMTKNGAKLKHIGDVVRKVNRHLNALEQIKHEYLVSYSDIETVVEAVEANALKQIEFHV